MSLPDRFARTETASAVVVLRDDVAAAALRGGIADPESLRRGAHAEYEGRGRPFGVEVPGVGRIFVRPYLHGGVVGRVAGDRHAGDGRFASELAAHAAAAAAGVPVCDALGYVSRAAGGLFRRGWLLLREIPGARDLLGFLDGGPAPARRRAVLASAGRAIRALHDAGFDHPDLHLKNLLLGPDGVVRVLDLDRVTRRPPLGREHRLAGLFRFDRYAAKQAARGKPVTRTDRLRVLSAYAGPDWPARDEVRALARRLRRHIARHDRMRAATRRAGAAT